MLRGTKEFKAVLINNGIGNDWFGLEYGNNLTIELEKKDFPFLEPNMEVNIKLTVEYVEKSGPGNNNNKNGTEYDIEEHN